MAKSFPDKIYLQRQGKPGEEYYEPFEAAVDFAQAGDVVEAWEYQRVRKVKVRAPIEVIDA